MPRKYEFRDWDQENNAIIRVRELSEDGSVLKSVHVKFHADRDDIAQHGELPDSIKMLADSEIDAGRVHLAYEADEA